MEPAEEKKEGVEVAEEVVEETPVPEVTGWVDREGPYRIYKDPETAEVTKIQVEGETFTK